MKLWGGFLCLREISLLLGQNVASAFTFVSHFLVCRVIVKCRNQAMSSPGAQHNECFKLQGRRAEHGIQKMKGGAERLRILQEYTTYYKEKSREGKVSLCDKHDLKELSAVWPECGPSAALRVPYYEVIKETYQKRDEQRRNELLRNLMKAFAVLELICINLFLYPWRKEIRILKRFTGNFVYYVEPVIPNHIVHQILQKVGYTEVTPTEFTIGQEIHTEEAKQSAFELFLARMQCAELTKLTAENKAAYADLFFTETSQRSDGSTTYKTREQSITDKNIQKVAAFGKQEGAYDLNFWAVAKEFGSNGTAGRIDEPDFVPLSSPHDTHDHGSHDNTGSSNCLSKSLDSEEFIKNYSDLNLAQQPIVLKHNSKKTKAEEKRLNQGGNTVSEETSVISEPPVPSTLNVVPKALLETGLCQTNDVTGKSDDVINVLHGRRKSSTEGSFANKVLSEPAMEFIRFGKGGHSGRSVVKLKMNDVFLTYPIEETLPPKCVALPGSEEVRNSPLKKTLKEAFDGVSTSPAVSGGLTTAKATFPIIEASECTGDTENTRRLREPPNSTYIPPVGAEREAGRPTEQQPEEDQFLSQPADMVQIDETIYKMNADTRDDFVLITRRENCQS